MSTPNQMLRLPPERIEQLKTLTAALGLASTADTVGHLIREQALRAIIPDAVPGLHSEAVQGGVAIQVGDALPTTYSSEIASKIVSSIRLVANGTASGTADIPGNFIVVRQGNGIRLHFPAIAPAKNVSPDVARDFARILEANIKYKTPQRCNR